jgi:uncharacterized membrane protein HdeD (DUF308 family)
MNRTIIGAAVDTLTERWWVPVLRGIAAIVFGVLALAAPQIGLLALVLMWGVYAIADGAFNLLLASWTGRSSGRLGWYLFEAVISIAAGILTFAYPGMTAMALLFIIALWAIATGIAEIAAAIELRRFMRNEWMLALAGVLSIAFGVFLFARPMSGALAVVWMIGAYAIAFGLLLIGVGVRLHGWRGARRMSTPTPA